MVCVRVALADQCISRWFFRTDDSTYGDCVQNRETVMRFIVVEPRPWQALSNKQLDDIINDTEKDCPDGNYCAAEIYCLAMELKAARQIIGLWSKQLEEIKKKRGGK
jgi:hypothetical protein